MSHVRKIRSGFTLLEMVIAIVLLTVGALGFTVVTTNLVRAFYLNARRTRAGEVAHFQRESLLRQGCLGAASGGATQFGLPVQWTVGPPGASSRISSIRVSRPTSAGLATDTLTGVIPCS